MNAKFQAFATSPYELIPRATSRGPKTALEVDVEHSHFITYDGDRQTVSVAYAHAFLDAQTRYVGVA